MRDSWRAVSLLAGLVMRAHRRLAVAIVVTTVVGEALPPVRALTLKMLVNAVGDANDHAVMFAGLTAGTVALEMLMGWVGLHLRMGMRERTTLVLDAHLASLTAGIPGVEHHERSEYLDKVAVLRDQRLALSGFQEALVWNVALVVRLLATVALLAAVHPVLLLLPLCAVPSLLIGARAEAARQQVQDDVAPRRRLEYRLFQLATTPEAGKELRVFGLGPELLSRYRAVRADVDRLEDRVQLRASLSSMAGWFVFGAAFVAAVVFVAARVSQGRATPGDLVLALTLASQVNGQVAGLVSMVSWMLGTLETGRRMVWLSDYADADRARVQTSPPRAVPNRIEAGIRIEGLTFRYPGTDVDVLRDVSFHLPAGTTVAIVGDNGAGKTTLVKLLCRFYDPTAGVITLDGTDLRDFDVEEWRPRITVAFQDFCHFELLAFETVGVGDLARINDRGAVLEAVAQAEATEIIAGLPAGFDTQLGLSFDGGVELSTGQWQRLSLGRALMREQPLLNILDEPTATLDAHAEHVVFERYANAGARAAAGSGAVTLLVSHRFSTVRMADLVVVLSRGRVVEVGSHTELLQSRGLYAELYELQARAYR